MEEEINPKQNNSDGESLDKKSELEQKHLKSSILQKTTKVLKRVLKYFLITVVGLVVIYFIVFFFKENSLKSLEESKKWVDYIPYFKINLTTSFRYNNVWDDGGRLLYQINLEADTNKYNYDKYDNWGKIIISFLDAEGYKIDQEELSIGDFTRIINEKNKVIGFRKKDGWYVNIKDYKSYTNIDVSWTVSFEKK